jgi:SSS family solute:Na+ symporter
MTNTFNFIDWAFIFGFLFISLIIGLIARKHISSIDEFLLVGRRLRSFRGIATLASTEMGLVTIIYFSEEAYSNGIVAIVAGIIAAVTMWVIGQTGFVISHLRSLGIRTLPEYFEIRFGTGVRWIAGVLIFLTGILNMGIFLQVEGKFLAIAMGLPLNSLPVIMGIILLIVISYTMLGGMHSVVITDVFQFLVLLVGIILISYFAFSHAGGISGMILAVKEHYGEAGFNLKEAPRYGLLFILWTTLYYTSGWSTWQPVVQRVFSMSDISTARKLYRISSIFMFLRASLPMLWGIAALAVLGLIPESQTALPKMMIRIIPAGFLGLIMVGFLAASMSTYDSYLLSFSAILTQDIIGPLRKKTLTGSKKMILIRVGIIIIGVFIYYWGIYYQFTETVFRYIALTGSLAFAGTLTGVVGGIYWRKASTAGAYLAFLTSAIPPIISLVNTEISTTHAGLLSFALAPVCLILGSYILPDKQKLKPNGSH